MIDLVTAGWLTTDDIVLTNGRCLPDVTGGGALYSAVGAQIWEPNVGIHSITGERKLSAATQQIAARGLDPAGISTIPGDGLCLWLLHETETDKQQVPKLASASAADMDRVRTALPWEWQRARGFHVAPQSPSGSFAHIAALSALPHRPVITLDILADRYVDASAYHDLSFLRLVSAFLPSREEINRIWHPADLRRWLMTQALAFECHVAAKLGPEGSLVVDAQSRTLHEVPAVAVSVVDTTGAGDAWCGGFLSGLALGLPAAECAARGAVSASYVIEAVGALATARPHPEERDERLAEVITNIRTTAVPQ